jgi:NADH dehydrogenase
MADTIRVLILGGGFGGLAVARELERILPRNAAVDVTLVNRDNFFLFTPMLHEIAASDLDITDIVNPLRKMLRRTRLFTGVVEQIDPERRVVHVSHAGGAHGHDLPYDYLVIALGATTNFHGIAGLGNRAFTMKSLGDAIELRNRLIEQLEEADFECAAGMRRPLCSFVVAGGGFAGVETVAAMHDFLRGAARYYRNLGPDDVHVTLVHSGAVVLPELGDALGRYTQMQLAKRGIDVVLEARVAAVDDISVTLSTGRTVPASTIVWTAGTAPNPVLETLPCEKKNGRIMTDTCMRVCGLERMFALGDCAYVPDPVTGAAQPPTAQHAIREGVRLARNIAAELRGEAAVPFRFSTIGLLATIGRRTGVASILGVNFSGHIAWWLWRTIYLSKLPRFEKKFRVALNWTLDVLFSKDLVQFQTRRT